MRLNVAAISLLAYFKPKDGLPDPLSLTLPSREIAGANSEVAKVIAASASGKKRGEYHK